MTTENKSEGSGEPSGGKRRGKKDDTPVVVVRTYDFVLWLLPKVEQFPRSFRFSVGERLVSVSLDLLLLLVEAAYAKDKTSALEAATRRTNALRFLIRLSKDLRLLSLESYKLASTRLEEIGRMAAGWQRWQAGRK